MSRGRGEDEIAHSRFDHGLGVDPMRGDQRAHAQLVSDIADDEPRARRHRPVEAGGQIIEYHYLLSSVEEGVSHVAADVAGAAGDQDRHAVSPFRAFTIVRLPRRKIRWSMNARVRAR